MKSLLTGNTDGRAVVQIVAESNIAERLHTHTHIHILSLRTRLQLILPSMLC